ncbi:hypothetical protein BH10CHL1_BH10CHL1_17490 [soil metagenome]
MSTATISPYQPASVTAHVPSRALLVLGLPICLGALLLAMLASIAFGAAEINATTVWQAIVAFNPENTNHLIIQTLRMPRAVTAALVGAALAVAGAIIQGLTRNPLADPGLLGIEAGAAFAVVGAVFLFQINSRLAPMLCLPLLAAGSRQSQSMCSVR